MQGSLRLLPCPDFRPPLFFCCSCSFQFARLHCSLEFSISAIVNDHFCYILGAVKHPTQQPDGRELLRHSGVESDRKFWRGERPLSIVQWIGVMLMFLAVGIVIAMSVWFEHNSVAVIVVLGGLALFVVMGNLRSRRSPKK